MRALLGALDAHGYDFVTITPASHARVARRWRGLGAGVRDLFGWSRAVAPDSLPGAVLNAARVAGVLGEREGGVASSVRVSRVCGRLFAHSAWPTEAEDSVFLGPDSYRFAAFIAANLPEARSGLRVIDIGTGAGVGAIVAAERLPGAEVTMSDVNAKALDFARANAAHAGVAARFVHARGMVGVEGAFDLALLNPPYIADAAGRAYRDGGDMLGARLSLDLALESLGRAAPGGRVLLYTGSAIVDGHDALRSALEPAVARAGARMDYRELDPDVFGEELDEPAYVAAERIALVGAVIVRPRD